MKFDRKVTVVNGKMRSRAGTSNTTGALSRGAASVSLSLADTYGPRFDNLAWQDTLAQRDLRAAVERHTNSSDATEGRLTSSYGNAGIGMDGGFGPTQQTGYFGGNAFTKTFDGILPEATEDTLIPYYRDIYYFDAIGGSACDMLSTFPYSDWQLSGVDTDKIPVYEDALARLGMRTLINEITLHYLVEGDFIGTLSYDRHARNFHDIFVHDRAYCRVIPAPFYSMQAMIQASANGRLNQFMNTPHRYRSALLKNYPEALLRNLASGLHDLNPLTTLHVPRRTLADRFSGSSSYLRRMLPAYLLEKALYRGTLIEANRRQRPTTHIRLGDDDWTPTQEEIEATLNAFKTTELDPLGAMIATRNGVDVQDILQAGEGYKWQDVTEMLTPIKLRSLSISEAFLAGDSSYACVTGDTLIPTDRGLIRVDSISDCREFKKAVPIQVTVDSRFGPATAIEWVYNGVQKTYRVSTEKGNSVCATENHPFLVLAEDCTHQWVRLDRLKVGDLVCVSGNRVVRETALPLPEGDLGLRLPSVMTKKLAEWIALHLYLNEDKFDSNECARNRLNELTADLFSNTLAASDLENWLIDLGVPAGDHRQSVPWCILEADAASQMAFLRGYANACDREDRTWVAYDLSLASQIQVMLNALGYQSVLTYGDDLGNWIVTLVPEQIDSFWSEVRAVSTRPSRSLFTYTAIDSIEYAGMQEVFDISMGAGNEPAFVANGIIVHNTAESAVATFMQNTSALRSYISYRTFTMKLFPLIAMANGFYKQGVTLPKINNPGDILNNVSNHKNLDIPKLVWTKDLSGGDPSARLELLDRMADKGFPIALRTIAAAAGQDVGMLLNDLKEDQALRNALRKLAPTASEVSDDAQANASGDDSVWASMRSGKSVGVRRRLQSQVTSGLGRVGMAYRINEGTDEDPEVHTLSRTGKRRAVINEHAHMRRQNAQLVKAVEALADGNTRAATLRRVRARNGGRIPDVLRSALGQRKG